MPPLGLTPLLLERPSGKENQKEDPRPWEGEGVIDLAASYSPTEWPLQYHRRWKA